MPDYHLLAELLGVPNVRVTHYQLVGAERINLFMESALAAALCPECQQVSLAVHETGELQFIRDLPLWNRWCWLGYAPRRFKCTSCNDTFVERVVWREPGLGYTRRYEQHLYERTHREPIAQVARRKVSAKKPCKASSSAGQKKYRPPGLSSRDRCVLGRSGPAQRAWALLPDYLRAGTGRGVGCVERPKKRDFARLV